MIEVQAGSCLSALLVYEPCVTRRNCDPAQLIIAKHDVQILYYTTDGCFTETKIFSDLIPGVEF